MGGPGCDMVCWERNEGGCCCVGGSGGRGHLWFVWAYFACVSL